MVGWNRSSPADETIKDQEPAINGFFRGREQLISGWILDLQDPQRKHDVEVLVGGKSIGLARGDRYDPLVQSHHGGDGHYAFAIYYDGELTSGPIETRVVDRDTGIELRSKQPFVKPPSRSGPPLEIHKVTFGKTVELCGRVGAYPWGGDLGLEFWVGEDRVASSLPVVGSQNEGLFTCQVGSEALRYLLAGNIEIALPGLKEAGLAVPVRKLPLVAVVSQQKDRLRIELRGDFEQVGPISVTTRFKAADVIGTEEISMASKVATIRPPADFKLGDDSIDILIADAAVPTRIEWPLLNDVQFQEVGRDGSPWEASKNARVDSGFFAFPASLADEHELSGHIAHVWRETDGSSLRLCQQIEEISEKGGSVSITTFVRGTRKAQLSIRLRDDKGVISETSVTSRTSDTWNLLRLNYNKQREIVGRLIFEVEASGRNVTDLEVTLGNSRQAQESIGDVVGSNLLANAGLEHWPHGAGVRQHSTRGEVCASWKIFNRGTPAPFFTRAVVDPSDSSLGLAAAAAEVTQYLRLEANFVSDDLTGRPLVLRFRAGCPPAARQLLARQADAIPQFAVIDRVFIIRRTRVTRPGSFEERDEVAAVFARKLPVSSQIEAFEYKLEPIEEREELYHDDAVAVDESYHLAFDFRHPTVIALYEVEILPIESTEDRFEPARLKVEDRNIELQIETLQAVSHWRGQTPVRVAAPAPDLFHAPLKWTSGPSRQPVAIVVPVYNALVETLACLDSMNGSTTVPILVRVIDDGSDKSVRDALEQYARDKPWVQVHSFSQNRGYTFAADYGIREACTDWVVLLNSDTIATRGWLEGMLSCAHSNPEIAFVGPLSNAASYQSVPELYDASRKWKINRLPQDMTPEDMADLVRKVSVKDYPEVPLLNGFCTLMKRSAFMELGGLNPTAFPVGYGEENDLCLRAGKAGFKLAVADDVYVYHVKSASFGNSRREELTKNGNAALRRLHPEVDISVLTTRFRETPALVAMRQTIRTELSRLHESPADERQVVTSSEPPLEPVEQDREPQLQKA